MKELIKKYIKEEIEKLKYKGDSVELSNVYPAIIEEVVGNFDYPYELNGYDCNYWVDTDEYSIWGAMRYGTATIQLIAGEDNPKLEEVNKTITDNANMEEIAMQDEAKEWSTFYFTFGYGQRNFGYYQPIKAENKSKAHKKMVELYGTKWSSVYTDDKWETVKNNIKAKPLTLVYAL